jgi:hypothetical protein
VSNRRFTVGQARGRAERVVEREPRKAEKRLAKQREREANRGPELETRELMKTNNGSS